MEMESIVIELIVRSGEAKSLAFEALGKAREGDFTSAEELLAQSREAGKLAHKVQTKLIETDGEDQKVPLSLVLVHAQDHLMDSILAQDLIEEMIRLYQRLEQQ